MNLVEVEEKKDEKNETLSRLAWAVGAWHCLSDPLTLSPLSQV
jgi:hypothetical protein